MDNEILQQVRQEFEQVTNTLRTHVSDEVAQRFVATDAALTEIRASLSQLRDSREVAPTAEAVQALEARLVESENHIREMQTRAAALTAPAATTREAQDEQLFRGRIFRDLNRARQVIRSVQSGQIAAGSDAESRAIDSTLFATGGQMSAETFDRFLDFVIEKTVALSRVTTRRMINSTGHTDQLTVSRRRLRAATEGTEPSLTNAIGVRRRTLTTVETIWAEDLTLTFLEDNIERRGAETHIARMLAQQFGNDLNDLAWNGDATADSSGSDAFITINNGWITLMLADPLVLDVSAAALSTNTDVLFEAHKQLAVEFQGMPDLAYFVSVPFGKKYADELSTRETNLGDQVMVQGFPAMRYFGMPVIPEPHLYEENVDKLVLTPLQNLYHGVQRNMTIDAEWRPRKRAIEFTITARNDYEYATGEGIILVSNIPASLR
jgi:hypothetical protein